MIFVLEFHMVSSLKENCDLLVLDHSVRNPHETYSEQFVKIVVLIIEDIGQHNVVIHFQ